MSQGYLYILINPTMPGLAKVGRTTRDPSTRVGELSSATGVASPFILAYSQPVIDCVTAERWVHSQLESAGFRHAANREFFTAPLHEIVPLVLQAAQLCANVAEGDGSVESSVNESDNVVQGLRQLAENYRDGVGVLINVRKALDLFEQAANMGDGLAAVSGGQVAQYGGGNLRPDLEKAMEMYQIAFRQNIWWVKACMADVFITAGQPQNADICWTEYFQHAVSDLTKFEGDSEIVHAVVGKTGAEYPYSCACGRLKPTVSRHLVEPFSETLINALEARAVAESPKLPWHLKGKNRLAIRVILEDILGRKVQH